MKKILALFLVLGLLAVSALSARPGSALTAQEALNQWYQLGALLRENGIYPYVELHRDDRGYEVMALQTRLFQLNYYDKEIVPLFGSGTESAMRRFEKVNGLKVNGWASVEDQQLLFKSSALPNTGTTVKPDSGIAPTAPPPTSGLPDLGTINPGNLATINPGNLGTINPGDLGTIFPIVTATPKLGTFNPGGLGPIVTLGPIPLITATPKLSTVNMDLKPIATPVSLQTIPGIITDIPEQLKPDIPNL